MSVFVQQQHTVCSFTTSDSWAILSPIEQSIKQKIEAVGTPLKDWDINIYRGVLTGCNEAFIISTEKRNEILANCKTNDERERTAELIRPILRGRDIKRYGYNWANLWLINTHNGVKERGIVKIPRIDINDYPAVKAHLDTYWNKIKDRSDQGDTPYNLRNCAYIEDFFKPKIMFQEIVQESQFCYDDKGLMCNDTGRIIVGNNLEYLLGVMNSKLFFFAVKTFYGGGVLGEHGIRMKHTFFEKFHCVEVDDKIKSVADALAKAPNNTLIDCFEHILYQQYELSSEEIKLIESQYIQ